MNRMMLLALFSLLLLLAGCRLGINRTPEAVRHALKTQFPDASHVEWEKDFSTYKAEFHHEGREKECWFSKDGDWVLTKTKLTIFDIPAPVLAAARDYSDWEIDNVALCKQSNGVSTYYEVEYEHEQVPGEKKIRILPNGTTFMDF